MAYPGDGIDLAYIRQNKRRGRVQPQTSQTLDCAGGGTKGVLMENLRIRKLTPKECWRLMGFDDSDFEKAEQSGISNTQLYKQAGNSIVVNVLEELFTSIYKTDALISPKHSLGDIRNSIFDLL